MPAASLSHQQPILVVAKQTYDLLSKAGFYMTGNRPLKLCCQRGDHIYRLDRLRFIAQSSWPVHSHQLPTFHAELSAVYEIDFFFKLSTLFGFYKQPVYEQVDLGT